MLVALHLFNRMLDPSKIVLDQSLCFCYHAVHIKYRHEYALCAASEIPSPWFVDLQLDTHFGVCVS